MQLSFAAYPRLVWPLLRKIARYIANICPLEAEDLLQTALTRALAGDRQCPVHVGVIRFLAEAMRSIASVSLKSEGASRRQGKSATSACG